MHPVRSCISILPQSFFLVLFLGNILAVAANAGEFQILPSNSDILFRVKHMGISSVTGRFGIFSGTFRFDPGNIAAAKGRVVIQSSSINTNNEKRDRHLISDEFLNADRFPDLIYVSKSVQKINNADSTCELVGDLTIRDITREIILQVKGTGFLPDDGRGNARAAFTANGKINRFDFGLKWNKAIETGALVAGTEVELILSFEGLRPVSQPKSSSPIEKKSKSE